MRESRFGWCFAVLLASCFSDAPMVGDDDDAATSSATGTATTDGPTTSTPTSTSSSTSTSTEPSTTSPPETGMSADTSETTPVTSDVTSIDPTVSSSGGTENCVLIDFDGDSIGCVEGELALPIGFNQVTFTNASGANPGVCVEHTSDGDGETSPLSGGYVWMQFVPNNPATLTFSAPVASVTMQVGPHHPEGSSANIAICGTIAEPCESAAAVATQDAPSPMMMDLAGTTELFMYMNKGIGNIAIDDLEVCFDE